MTNEWLRELRKLESLTEHEYQLFEWYLRDSEALVAQMESEELSYIQQQISSGAEDPNDTGLLAVAYYARRVRYSHVIHLASMLEAIMKRECSRLMAVLGEQTAPFSPAELKGDPWTTKRKALERYGHFEIPDEIWKRVRRLLDVRNVLVHDNGDAASMSAGVSAELAQLPGIRFSPDEIEVEQEFVHEAFSVRETGALLSAHVHDIIDRRVRLRPT